MKKHRTIIIFVSLAILVLTSAVCNAAEWSRKGKGEIYIFGQYMSGDSTTGPTPIGEGTLEMDNTFSGGFGAGYNFHENFNVNLDTFFGSPQFTAKINGITVDKVDAFLYGGNINLDVNILKDRLTPLISGGIGFMRFSGDWENGSSFDETDFSYNAGSGFRWDVSDHFLIKAVYRATWTKIKDTDKSLMFNGAVLSIGYIF